MAKPDTPMHEQAEVANALFEKGRFEEALETYRLMAESGSIEAQLRVGWMYQTGRGVKVNLDEARRWYLTAAESNSPEAQFYLGRLYRAEKFYQQAMTCFQKSAEQNYMPAVYQLGVMYERGEGVQADTAKAFKYYERAARMGHLRGQRDVAVLLIKGHLGLKGVPRGLLMLVRFSCAAFKLVLTDRDSDRIRW